MRKNVDLVLIVEYEWSESLIKVILQWFTS